MRESHPELRTARTRAAFISWRGDGEAAVRQALIDALPKVEWHGRTLYTLRCGGTSGKGPHAVHVPLAQLWALIDPRRYRCPYHVGDAVPEPAEARHE